MATPIVTQNTLKARAAKIDRRKISAQDFGTQAHGLAAKANPISSAVTAKSSVMVPPAVNNSLSA